MKQKFLTFMVILIAACATPQSSQYKDLSEINLKTMAQKDYTIATWYKINKPGEPIRIYIEGDGNSFDKYRRPTNNPTPHSNFWINMAKADPHPNVAYLARPCQYIKSPQCSQKDWTTGRFSETILSNMNAAVNELMQNAKTNKVVLIGYSGGGQIASQLAMKNAANLKYLYTVAGVLDHNLWTQYHNATPLFHSRTLEVKELYKLPQMHFVGQNDKIVPPELTKRLMPGYMVTVVPNATHSKGWDAIKPELYK